MIRASVLCSRSAFSSHWLEFLMSAVSFICKMCLLFKKINNTFCINSTQKITGSRPLCLFQMKVASHAATAPPGVP